MDSVPDPGVGPEGSLLTDHIFEVTVQRAHGLKLVPSLKYFLSYTFQSTEDAEPLCTKPMAPRSVMDINARACHTISLPQSETVLMNIGSFHGQNLGFDLRSVSVEEGKPGAGSTFWHATGSLDFMELVEMTCEDAPRASRESREKAFTIPLKLNEEFYSASLRQRSRPSLTIKIRYTKEDQEDPRLEVAPRTEPQGAEEGGVRETPHLPERRALGPQGAAPGAESLVLDYEDEDIEVLGDEQTNLDIENFQITGSNSMKAKVDFSIGKVCGLRTMMSSAAHDRRGAKANLKGAMRLGPNTFITTRFAPMESYLEELLPETTTDFKAENWIPDFEFFRSFNMYLSPSTVNLMTKENIEIEVWHYTPSRQNPLPGTSSGKKVLLGVCRIPWANVLTCPRGIYGLHTVTCPRLQTPVGAIEVNVTLQMRSYMLQNSSILESRDPVREMLPEDFVEHNRKSVDLFSGKYANFVVSVDKVSVSASDALHFNRKLRYCVAMAVNGFMGETVSKAVHPKPSSSSSQSHTSSSARGRMWERLNLSHKSFKSFKVDKFFVAAINNSPLTVKLLECDENRPDVEIALGDIDLSQLLLERNSVSETSRMISGTYTLVPCKRDYVEIRVRVKILLKGTAYTDPAPTHPQENVLEEGDPVGPKLNASVDDLPPSPRGEGARSELSRSLENLKALKALKAAHRHLGSQERRVGGGEEGESDDSDTMAEIAQVSEVLSLIESQESQESRGESNDVLICIEDALHLSGKVSGSQASPSPLYAYVTVTWPSSSSTGEEAVCSSLADCIEEGEGTGKHKCKWYFTKHLSFKDLSPPLGSSSSDPPGAGQRAIVLQVWARHVEVSQSIDFADLDDAATPDSGADALVGSASVDITALFSGLDEIHGWYNVLDYNQRCCGQLKVRISLQNGKKPQPPLPAPIGPGPLLDLAHLKAFAPLQDREGLKVPLMALPADSEPRGSMEEGDSGPSLIVTEETLPGGGGGGDLNLDGGASEASLREDFFDVARTLCTDLGHLEEKIKALSSSTSVSQGAPVPGREEEEEEIFLNQIDFSLDTYPSAPPLVGPVPVGSPIENKDLGKSYGGKSYREGDTGVLKMVVGQLVPRAGGGGDLEDTEPEPPKEHQRRDAEDTGLERPGFNFDRIARIMSAG